MELIKWKDLDGVTRAQVKNAYVHWHYDTTSKTFEEWAGKHAFYVTKDRNLSRKHRHCEPEYLAD